MRQDPGRRRGEGLARGAVAALLASVLALGCPAREEPGQPAQPVETPTSEFRGVELVREEADGSSWRLSAEEGSGWEGAGTGVLLGVKGEIRRRGQGVGLEAGRAQIDALDVIRLSGGVEVAWGEYRARMDRAEYHRREGRVTSQDPVALVGPALRVRGRGLDVDVEGRRARLEHDVHAWIRGGGDP